MDVAPYLYCAIDDSVMLDLHMQHILSDYVICEILLITLVIRRLSTAMLFVNYNDYWLMYHGLIVIGYVPEEYWKLLLVLLKHFLS
jgi:hypothetical protein